MAAQAAAISSSSVATETYFHSCADGKRLEVLRTKTSSSSSKPPLLFVHGSYHAAWCWEEKFFPYFAALGYECYAVSLRAQGGSDRVEGAVAGTLDTHARDLAGLIKSLPKAPVVVSHSFGGLIMQK
mgnify:CR=1 FL=1